VVKARPWKTSKVTKWGELMSAFTTVTFPLVGPAGVWFVSEVHCCHIVAGVNAPLKAMF